MFTMKCFSPRVRRGYTLLEMVIAVSLFVIISVVVLNNFRQGQRLDDLKTGSVEMVSNFREMQTLGMSGQVVNICHGGENDLDSCAEDTDCPNGVCGLVPAGGFGISIGPVNEGDDGEVHCYDAGASKPCRTNYTLFADTVSLFGINGRFEKNNDITLDVYDLPNNVRIRDFHVVCSWKDEPEYTPCPPASPFGIDVSFRPPRPTPFLHSAYGGFPGTTYSELSVKILIEHISAGKCRMVTINGISGQVSENPDPDCHI